MAEEQGLGLTTPSFFKVYLPCRSSHHLRIPTAFLKHFNGDFPNEATLKDTIGNLWHIELEEDKDGVSLKHGWQKFVTDYSLECGDFLVFRYNGNYLFDVRVYGKNGCIKNHCTINEPKLSLLPVKLEDEPNGGRTRHKLIRNCKRKAEGLCNATQGKSRRITFNAFEPSKATDSSGFAMTKNLHFIASLHPKSPHQLNIPRDLVKENRLKLEKKMVFRTQSGKLWPVRVLTRRDGRNVIGTGWKDFWMGNNIKPQDKCRFEFVFRKNRRILRKEILVTIIHASTKKRGLDL